jgi:hypothetical protein
VADQAFEALQWGSPQLSQAARKIMAHRRRCLRLPELKRGEAEQLVSAFLAKGGTVTVLPAAYAAPVR